MSPYLDYVPAIFAEADEDGVLEKLLEACEAVLTVAGDVTFDPTTGDVHGAALEQILDGKAATPDTGPATFAGVQRYFDPGPGADPGQRAPDRFLDWLAGWVALTLRADLDAEGRRAFIARAVSLAGRRATRAGLMEYIRGYTSTAVSIEEFATGMQLGVHSTVGVDTVIEGGPPHHFSVTVRLPAIDERLYIEQHEILTAIIDAEKPAHTRYTLDIQTPTLQIGVTSTIDVDTLIGVPAPASP